MALITHKQYLSGITLWPSSHTNSIFLVPHYGPHHTQTVSFWYHTMDLNTKPHYFSGTAKLAWRYKYMVFPVPHYDPRHKTTVFFYGPEHKTTVSFWYHPISSTQKHSILLVPPYVFNYNKKRYLSDTTLWTRTQKQSIFLVPPYVLNTKPQYLSGTMGLDALPVHYFVQLVGMIRCLVASQDSARAAHSSHDLLR